MTQRQCMRCKQKRNIEEDFPKHPLSAVCNYCLEHEPRLTPEEKTAMNRWDQIEDFLETYHKMLARKWSWASKMDCKYIELRIDMRDGGCIIADRNGKRISPDQLAWQYSKETPEPPKF